MAIHINFWKNWFTVFSSFQRSFVKISHPIIRVAIWLQIAFINQCTRRSDWGLTNVWIRTLNCDVSAADHDLKWPLWKPPDDCTHNHSFTLKEPLLPIPVTNSPRSKPYKHGTETIEFKRILTKENVGAPENASATRFKARARFHSYFQETILLISLMYSGW